MILAIVQARMSSTRLYGKIMKEILGKPLIGYLLESLTYSRRINKIVVATSTGEENNRLCNYVESQGFDVYRGSEDDVLDRFYQAAVKYRPDSIVRVTGDCPLIDPGVCDRLIDEYVDKEVDYACLGLTFAEGLDCEIFSFDALESAYKNARMQSEREHVTPYIYSNPDLFSKFTLENKTDDSKYRFTVDESQDFEVVKTIIENLYRAKGLPLSSGEIKRYLDDHPDIVRKNMHIMRNEGYLKSVKQDRTA